jgi:hypothetical protein
VDLPWCRTEHYTLSQSNQYYVEVLCRSTEQCEWVVEEKRDWSKCNVRLVETRLRNSCGMLTHIYTCAHALFQGLVCVCAKCKSLCSLFTQFPWILSFSLSLSRFIHEQLLQ